MGQAIMRSIAEPDDLILTGIWVRAEQQAADLDVPDGVIVSDDLDAVAARADVIVDFSLPEATSSVLAAVANSGTALVCGVSGLSDNQLAELDAAAAKAAIVFDRNMSVGVAVLEDIVQRAASALGADFSVEIQETHHVHKIDAPSGTALKLGEAIATVRGLAADDIHYEVERRGEVPGDHTVILASATERLSLGHSVTTRQVFADGALRATRWVVGQPPGRYSMQDVLASSAAKKTDA